MGPRAATWPSEGRELNRQPASSQRLGGRHGAPAAPGARVGAWSLPEGGPTGTGREQGGQAVTVEAFEPCPQSFSG